MSRVHFGRVPCEIASPWPGCVRFRHEAPGRSLYLSPLEVRQSRAQRRSALVHAIAAMRERRP